MADKPAPPWKLRCPWCPWYVIVHARGAHGNDPGSGVAAARIGEDHAAAHGKTWPEFLRASGE